MASRTSSSRRAGSSRTGGRSSSSQKNNQMPLMLGGAGVLVLIVILVLSNKGGGDDTNDSGSNPSATQPEKQSAAPSPELSMASAKSGKTPDRPAPALTQDTLNKMNELYAEAKAISDEGMKLLGQGNNMDSRTKQSEAKVKVDQIKSLIEAPSSWYEEADFGGWAIPAEYETMNKIYGKVSRLEKTIRMNGGK